MTQVNLVLIRIRGVMYKVLRFLFGVFGRVDSWIMRRLEYVNNMRGIARKVYLFPESRGGCMDIRSQVKYPENIIVGNNCVMSLCTIGAQASVRIGDNVTISKGAVIETGSLTRTGVARHKALPIVIGDRVWIASNAIILGGSVIEDDCLIGAGAVFSGHLTKGSIYLGSRTGDSALARKNVCA
jgi:acetyltransferase-like isoleucine patch superfamily enzyme